MGRIYRNARTVLVCLGQDLDGGAEDVAGLVKENADLVSKYGSIAEMPVLAPDDSLFDDSRWKSLATLTHSCLGIARGRLGERPSDPVWRSRLQLPRFHETGSVGRAMRTESGTARFGFFLLYPHTDWLDWSPD